MKKRKGDQTPTDDTRYDFGAYSGISMVVETALMSMSLDRSASATEMLHSSLTYSSSRMTISHALQHIPRILFAGASNCCSAITLYTVRNR